MHIDESKKKGMQKPVLNYYIIAAIFIGILFFTIANAYEVQINEQLDFFELVFILAYAAPAGFSFAIARRYWPSTVFGKAYLSLGIAYSATSIAAFLFNYYQIWEGIENPYPSWIDVLFASFYPFAIYHLKTNIYFIRGAQKPKLKMSHILILIVIPLGVTSLYAFGSLVPVSFSEDKIYDDDSTLNLLPKVVSHIQFGDIEEYDDEFWPGYFAGIFFVGATTFTFSWAIIGAQVFQRSMLGMPWGLLLVGIGMGTVADVAYYYTSIFYYDRTNPIISIWVLGCILVCYALYLHKKQI